MDEPIQSTLSGSGPKPREVRQRRIPRERLRERLRVQNTTNMAPERLGIGRTGVQAGQTWFQDSRQKYRGVAKFATCEIDAGAGGSFRIETRVAARDGFRAVAGRAQIGELRRVRTQRKRAKDHALLVVRRSRSRDAGAERRGEATAKGRRDEEEIRTKVTVSGRIGSGAADGLVAARARYRNRSDDFYCHYLYALAL